MAKMPDWLKEMTKWPHTPSQRRIRDALRFHQSAVDSGAAIIHVNTDNMSPAEARRTTAAMVDTVEAQLLMDENNWQEWALETFQNEAAAR